MNPSTNPKGHALRESFLKFFEKKEHTIYPSAPLVGKDPSLLFTNAGMVPFKPFFLGEKPKNTKITSAQACIRAGGKHNDLDAVGPSLRHHTLFEMLGNFSFGAYQKEEAISYAFEFLQKELALNTKKLWFTVHQSDEESRKLWRKIAGVSDERIISLSDESNFWQMADTGPCGTCTEIFYDHGDHIEGGLPGSQNEEGPRYVEIWNLVFTQFDKKADGTLAPLSRPCVDTGMGLERISAVLEGTEDNYQTSLFLPIFELMGETLSRSPKELSKIKHARILADHLRTTAFLVSEGLAPGREGQSYVLRRVMRRALRSAKELGISHALSSLVEKVAKPYENSYPSLKKIHAWVQTIKEEEERFLSTLNKGMEKLNRCFESLQKGEALDGETIFTLYDTYGFPADMTEIIAKENGFKADIKGFELAMGIQKERSKSHSGFLDVRSKELNLSTQQDTLFLGYEHEKKEGVVQALFQKEEGSLKSISSLNPGEKGIVVLNQTPFYPESGGQAGDQGMLLGAQSLFEVHDTKKKDGVILHEGLLKRGTLSLGNKILSEVPRYFRKAVASNHSATHLLHKALKKILGEHVTQKGSLVSFDELRFDFSHSKPMTQKEIQNIENEINAQILLGGDTKTIVTTPDKAMELGAIGLFGEKYGSEVRVLSLGTIKKPPSLEEKEDETPYSIELCGGIHIDNTLEIGAFKIISEGSVASGVRRIVAKTSLALYSYLEEEHVLKEQMLSKIGAPQDRALEQLNNLFSELSSLRTFKKEAERKSFEKWLKEILHLPFFCSDNCPLPLSLIKAEGAKILSQIEDTQVFFFAETSPSFRYLLLCGKANNAKILSQNLHEKLGGKGGGKAELTQGSLDAKSDEVFSLLKTLLESSPKPSP